MKKALKIVLIILAVLILLIAAYVIYVFASYHRMGDSTLIPINNSVDKTTPGESYSILSYNIGFGAYESDYGFFMDGGTQSWAWSKERLDTNLKNITNVLKKENTDFYLIQEVDTDSTRSYYTDERDYIIPGLPGYSYSFARNYDSPFLFYPIFQPHGASRSGILTLANKKITSADRVELPIEEGLTKLLDLDRCFSKNRIATNNGGQLIIYNFHLSAYTSDGSIATEQLIMLLKDMESEYQQGNYCIAGGDFNKDILGNSSDYFGKSDIEYTWAQPLPEGLFDNYNVYLVAPFDENNPVPTCRNADSAYHKGQYVLTIDGFMVTNNVRVSDIKVIDTQFAYSDHNPVRMNFTLVK